LPEFSVNDANKISILAFLSAFLLLVGPSLHSREFSLLFDRAIPPKPQDQSAHPMAVDLMHRKEVGIVPKYQRSTGSDFHRQDQTVL